MGAVPTLVRVTPIPPAPRPPRPAATRGSTALVWATSVLSLLVSLTLVFLGLVGVRVWQVGLGGGAPVPTGQVTPAPAPTASGTPRPRPAQTTGPVQVTDSIMRGVVLVSGRTPVDEVAGTGMVLTDDGLVLTNYHVVRSTESITVTVAATGRRYSATLVGRDATADVALLDLQNASGLEAVTIDADPVRTGDIVIAAGNANGQGYVTAHRGNVLGLGRSIQVRGPVADDPPETLSGLIETNAPAWPGDSGGPMFDADLEVLGMTTAGSTGSEETKQVYAVPISEALDVVDRIRAGDEGGTIVIGPKSYLGIIAKTEDAVADGVVVDSLGAGTPAGRAGLQAGDRIVELDGQPVANRLDLSHVLDTIEPGTTVEIGWVRAGVSRTADITLTESPFN